MGPTLWVIEQAQITAVIQILESLSLFKIDQILQILMVYDVE